MNSVLPSGPAATPSVEHELAALEQRQASLIAHTRALRAANESLRHDLADAQARNKLLTERVAEATRCLDVLLSRLPEPAE